MQSRRETLHDIPGLVNLAALDRRVAPEAAPDRLGERLRAVDDEQTRHRRIEAALDQVVDQRLHHSAVLGCPFHQPKRVLEALAIDPERRHQNEMLTDVNAVDLHHHDVERGQVRTHPLLPARSRPSRIPAFRYGSKLCARPSVLMAWIASQEGRGWPLNSNE